MRWWPPRNRGRTASAAPVSTATTLRQARRASSPWRTEPTTPPARADEVHIRRYEPGDKRAVRWLHDDALNKVGAHLGTGPWDDDLDDIEGIYLESGGEFLVGILEGEVIAMGAIKRVSPDA